MKGTFFLFPVLAGLVLVVLVFGLQNKAAFNRAAFHSPDGIHFNDSSLTAARLLAKNSRKPLFILVHANWCGTCKQMKKKVLREKVLGDFYNANFVSAAVNYDSAEGQALCHQYQVSEIPAFLYLTADGQLVGKTTGFKDEAALIATAKNLKAAP